MKASKKDKPKHTAAFAKSETCEIRMIYGPYKGVDIVNIREFKNWQGRDGDMLPTASGFTVKPEEFRKFVKSLIKFGRESGLIPAKGEEASETKKKPREEEEPAPKKKKTVKEEEQDDDDEEDDESSNIVRKKKEEKKKKRLVPAV